MCEEEVGTAARNGVHNTNTGPLARAARDAFGVLATRARLHKPGAHTSEHLRHAGVLSSMMSD